MSKQQSELESNLLRDRIEATKTPPPATDPQSDLQEYEYREKSDEPKVNLSKPVLLVVAPLLVVLHFWVSSFIGIPVLQYAFVTCLVAFLINYMGVIRRY